MVSTVGIEEIRDEVKRMYSSSQATQTISVKPIDEFPNPGRWEPHQIALVTNGRFVGEAKRSRHSSKDVLAKLVYRDCRFVNHRCPPFYAGDES